MTQVNIYVDACVDGQCRAVGMLCVFFFQAEDGIRDAQESRGLGDVYKRQIQYQADQCRFPGPVFSHQADDPAVRDPQINSVQRLSLIHI